MSDVGREVTRYTEPISTLQASEVVLSDLVAVRNELASVLGRADRYVLALEKLLEGKLTPTAFVNELKDKVHDARSQLVDLRRDLQEIEKFLDSYSTASLSEDTDSSFIDGAER